MCYSNALTTVAMLGAILDTEKKDYLDLITPYFCNLLPRRGQKVNFIEVQRRMETEFGFKTIPVGVLHKIVRRICEQPNPLCKKESDEMFWVQQDYDNSEFLRNRSDTKQSVEIVIEDLKKYLKEERSENHTTKEVKDLFFGFLDKCGIYIIRENGSVLSMPVSDRSERYIAAYIRKHNLDRTSIDDKILELAKGYMVYSAIYFFSQNNCNSSFLSLAKVDIFIDTPIILNALCYDTQLGNRAVWDALNMALKLGATIKVFRHNVEEARAILYAFYANYPRIQTFKLEALVKAGYSGLTVKLLGDQIEKRISDELGFEIVDAPIFGGSTDLKIIEVEQNFMKYYKDQLAKRREEIGEIRIENDVRSLTYIVNSRNHLKPSKMSDCSAIFLSESYMAKNALKTVYNDCNCINLAYNIMDFSCISWLATYSEKTNVASDLLMYNASACIKASNAIISKMLIYVDQLLEARIITEEAAFILRVEPVIKEAAAEITGNDVLKFTPDMVPKILGYVVENRAKEIVSEEYAPMVEQLIAEMAILRVENSKLNDIVAKNADEEKKREEYIVLRANKMSHLVGAIVRIVVAVLIWCACAGLIGLGVYGMYQYNYKSFAETMNDGYKNDRNIYLALLVFSFALAALGITDSVIPRFRKIEKFTKRIENDVADIIYYKMIGNKRK